MASWRDEPEKREKLRENLVIHGWRENVKRLISLDNTHQSAIRTIIFLPPLVPTLHRVPESSST